MFCLVTETLDDLAAAAVVACRRVLELLVNQALDQPVLAQQHGDLGERVPHALARFGPFIRRFGGNLGHGQAAFESRSPYGAEASAFYSLVRSSAATAPSRPAVAIAQGGWRKMLAPAPVHRKARPS